MLRMRDTDMYPWGYGMILRRTPDAKKNSAARGEPAALLDIVILRCLLGERAPVLKDTYFSDSSRPPNL